MMSDRAARQAPWGVTLCRPRMLERGRWSATSGQPDYPPWGAGELHRDTWGPLWEMVA